MGLEHLTSRVSSDELDELDSLRNPSPFEDGFDPDAQEDAFNSLFSETPPSLGSGFGSLGDSGIGQGSVSGFDSLNSFGGGWGDSFGQAGQMSEQRKSKLDEVLDSAIDEVGNVSKVFFSDLRDSFSVRTGAEILEYAKKVLRIGGILGFVGLFLVLVGRFSGVIEIGIMGAGGVLFVGGLLLGSYSFLLTGLVQISELLVKPTQYDRESFMSSFSSRDIGNEGISAEQCEYEGLSDDVISMLEEYDFMANVGDFEDESEENFEGVEEESGIGFSGGGVLPNIDNFGSFDDFEGGSLDNVDSLLSEESEGSIGGEMSEPKMPKLEGGNYVTRGQLVRYYAEMLPTSTPDFQVEEEIASGSDEFKQIEVLCLKAMSNAVGKDIGELNTEVMSLKKTKFSYIIYMKRTKLLPAGKLKAYKDELDVYFKKDSSDSAVYSSVVFEGDYCKIVIATGFSGIITLGDVLRNEKAVKYFEDRKRELPVALGVDDLGEVQYIDMKGALSVMYAGKGRSGKSWSLLNIMLTTMLFNKPTDIQYLVCDPKNSNLFSTLALMPHVNTLIGVDMLLPVMTDLIENEGYSRKEILKEAGYENIWDYRASGKTMPAIFLVIDEVMTVVDYFEHSENSKDKDMFLSKLNVIITQLPAFGIGVMFVPHRATGVVTKTTRSVVAFKAIARGNISDTQDTLGDSKWSRALTEPGDTGYISADMANSQYYRGIAIGRSDIENSQLIRRIARQMYENSVSLPDLNLKYMTVDHKVNMRELRKGV